MYIINKNTHLSCFVTPFPHLYYHILNFEKPSCPKCVSCKL